MQRHFFIAESLVLSLILWMGSAFAASETETAEAAKALREADPTLTEKQARELVDLAAKDIESRAVRELSPTERERGGLGLGRPDAGEYPGGPMPEMTPEEKALADKVDARYRELSGKGLSDKEIDGAIQKEFEKELSGFKEKMEREHPEWKEGPLPKEEMDRYMKEHPDMKEQMEKMHESPEKYREMEQHERPTYEPKETNERPAYERPVMEQPPQEHYSEPPQH